MKELVTGVWVLIWALFVTTLMWSIGTLYSLGYSIWLTVTMRKPFAFFKFWWRIIDGFMAAIGHILFETAYALDLTWNVNGEIIEDIVTTEEKTSFTKKNITVSASVGELEISGKLNKSGKKFSSMLNLFFKQKQHAVDSWRYLLARKELKDKYFKKN